MLRNYSVNFSVNSCKLSVDSEVDESIIKIKFDEILIDNISFKLSNSEKQTESSSVAIKSAPEEFKAKLEKNPILLELLQNDEIKGRASINWPEIITSKVAEHNFVIESHVANYKLLDNAVETGDISVKLTVTNKDSDNLPPIDNPLSTDFNGVLVACKELLGQLDPGDVMYVVSDGSRLPCRKNLPPNPFDKNGVCFEDFDIENICFEQGQRDRSNIESSKALDPPKQTHKETKKTCIFDNDSIDPPEKSVTDLTSRFCLQYSQRDQSNGVWGNAANSQHTTYTKKKKTCKELFGNDVSDSNDITTDDSTSRSVKTCNFCDHRPIDEQSFGSMSQRLSQFCPERKEFPQNLRHCTVCYANLEWMPSGCACPKCGYKNPLSASARQSDAGSDCLNNLSVGLAVPKPLKAQQLDDLCNLKPKHVKSCKNPPDIHHLTKTLNNLMDTYENKFEEKNLKCLRAQMTSKILKKNSLKNPYEKHDDGGCPTKKLHDKKVSRTDAVGNENESKKRTKNQANYKQKRFNKKYSYIFGRKYPGIVVGHRTCNEPKGLVPKHMGWLWNINTYGINKLRRGWKPGAVTRSIKELMCYFLSPYPCDTLPVTKSDAPMATALAREKLVQKPTLRVQKKHDKFVITLNPLKDSNDMKSAADPYLMDKPVKFMISRPLEDVKRNILSRELQKLGFSPCTCNKPLIDCKCRNCHEQSQILIALDNLTKQLNLMDVSCSMNFNELIKDESKLDLEFTPPAGLVKPHLNEHPAMIYRETQYDEKDYLLNAKTTKDVKNNQKAKDRGKTKGDQANKLATNDQKRALVKTNGQPTNKTEEKDSKKIGQTGQKTDKTNESSKNAVKNGVKQASNLKGQAKLADTQSRIPISQRSQTKNQTTAKGNNK